MFSPCINKSDDDDDDDDDNDDDDDDNEFIDSKSLSAGPDRNKSVGREGGTENKIGHSIFVVFGNFSYLEIADILLDSK